MVLRYWETIVLAAVKPKDRKYIKQNKMQKGRTDVDLVPSEGVPINHTFVEFDESPILGEPTGPGRSLDWLTVENEADNTLARVDTVLDCVQKLVQVPDPRLRAIH
jgi:hypothetical protein